MPLMDQNRDDGKDSPEPEVETETKRLIEEAMKKQAPLHDKEQSDEESATKIDVVFQRLQARMIGLLDSIEDSVRSVEPELGSKVTEVVEDINQELAAAGLGVFGTRAAKIVNDELKKSLSADQVLATVFNAIHDSRDSVEDIMTKAGKGATRNIGQSTGNLQARLVQMYATLNEMEKRLESSRAELRKWRGRSAELEERIRQKDEVFSVSSEELSQLRQKIDELNKVVSEKDNLISSLKGKISQAQSQIEQQKQLMSNMDSVDRVSAELDAKVLRFSETEGKLTETAERLSKRESEVETLRMQMGVAAEEKVRLEAQLREIAEELAEIKGLEHDYRSEAEELRTRLRELQTRWETLYRVAEEEAAWKAYFLVADKTQWFPLSHLSSALGVPTVLLKRNLQKFVDVGLVEIDGDKVRPRHLSDLVKDSEGMDAQMLEEAKTELDKTSKGPLDSEEGDPEYSGPQKGEDYEQEGR